MELPELVDVGVVVDVASDELKDGTDVLDSILVGVELLVVEVALTELSVLPELLKGLIAVTDVFLLELSSSLVFDWVVGAVVAVVVDLTKDEEDRPLVGLTVVELPVLDVRGEEVGIVLLLGCIDVAEVRAVEVEVVGPDDCPVSDSEERDDPAFEVLVTTWLPPLVFSRE